MSFNVELTYKARPDPLLTGMASSFIPNRLVVTGHFTLFDITEAQAFVELVLAASVPAFGKRLDMATIEDLLERGKRAQAEAEARESGEPCPCHDILRKEMLRDEKASGVTG